MTRITLRQKGEFMQRAFWGDEFWIKTNRELDEMLAFRKTIKGKPDIYQRAQLELNAVFISFYERLLFGRM